LLQGFTTDDDYAADGHDVVHFRVPYDQWLQPDGEVRSVANKVTFMMSWCRKCLVQLHWKKKGKACGAIRTKLSWWRKLSKKFPVTAKKLTKALGTTAKAFAKHCTAERPASTRS
jgi:hypothetical protein